MSRFTKTYLSLLAGTLVCTILSAAFGSRADGSKIGAGKNFVEKFVLGHSFEPVPLEESYEITDGFRAVHIEWGLGDVILKPLPAGQTTPRLSVRGRTVTVGGSSSPLKFRVRTGVLEIEGPDLEALNVLGHVIDINQKDILQRMNLKLELELPADWKGDIKAETVSGQVSLDPGLEALDVDVDTVSGDVHLNGRLGKISVDTVSGNVKARLPDGSWHFRTESTSGKISNARASDPKGRPVEIETVSGDIGIE